MERREEKKSWTDGEEKEEEKNADQGQGKTEFNEITKETTSLSSVRVIYREHSAATSSSHHKSVISTKHSGIHQGCPPSAPFISFSFSCEGMRKEFFEFFDGLLNINELRHKLSTLYRET